MTKDDFIVSVKVLLKSMLDKSPLINLDDNIIFNYKINIKKFIQILLNRGIIQQVDDNEYIIPRRNLDRKLGRLFIFMERYLKQTESTILEDEGMGGCDIGGATSADSVNGSAPIGKLNFR